MSRRSKWSENGSTEFKKGSTEFKKWLKISHRIKIVSKYLCQEDIDGLKMTQELIKWLKAFLKS